MNNDKSALWMLALISITLASSGLYGQNDMRNGTLGLHHPSKVDDLCVWDEKVIWRITHIP